jgi:hypothetical protein
MMPSMVRVLIENCMEASSAGQPSSATEYREVANRDNDKLAKRAGRVPNRQEAELS